MRAIVLEKFGGLDSLVYRDLPTPEPKPGQVLIEIKAFGINHAEMHMRRGEWAEAAKVIGIECVGIVKACLGGEFPIGAKVAALMGGLGRTINGSYAEYTVAPATNVALIDSDLSWAELAAIPETYATAWTCLFRNLEIEKGQTVVIRGATSSFGQAAVKLAVNAGARVIATTRSRERFDLLKSLGAERVELEGPDLSKRIAEADRRGARSGRQQHDPRFARHAAPWRPRLPGRLAWRARADRRFQSVGANGERSASDLLRQLRVRYAGLPAVGRATPGDRARRCGGTPQGKTVSRLPL